MPAACRAGAAETAAAPPPKSQSCTQHIVWGGGPTHLHGRWSHLHPLEFASPSEGNWLMSLCLCTAGSRTAVSLVLHPPPPPPPKCLRGSEVSHQAVIILGFKAVVVQRKEFRFCFLFFDSCFHLERFDGWCFVLWHSEWDLWFVDRDRAETWRACWPVAVELPAPHPCFKLRSPDYLVWSKDFFLVQTKGGWDKDHYVFERLRTTLIRDKMGI